MGPFPIFLAIHGRKGCDVRGGRLSEYVAVNCVVFLKGEGGAYLVIKSSETMVGGSWAGSNRKPRLARLQIPGELIELIKLVSPTWDRFIPLMQMKIRYEDAEQVVLDLLRLN